MYIPVSLIASAILGFLPAPDTQQAPAYKVEFTIGNGTATTPQASKRYSMLVDDSRKAAFQALGDIYTDCGSPQSIDTGAKIELTIHTSEGKVAIDGVIDFTSVTGTVNLASLCEPIIGERKIVFNNAIELGKPITISDHIEAVVTKAN